MHEVTAHPAAPDVIRLFAPHLGQAYDPILTPGTPLGPGPVSLLSGWSMTTGSRWPRWTASCGC